MPSSPTLSGLIRPAACVLAALVCCGRVVAQSNLAIELKETQATLQAATTRIADMETRLAKAKEQLNSLVETLAATNGDAQQARESYERLRYQLEGLGITALDTNSDGLQQRLLTALSDLRVLDGQNRSLATALLNLSQSALDYARAAGPVDGEPKKELDLKLSQAEQALASLQREPAPANESALLDARVVALKDDTGVAVVNVGSRHGVHPGMPFAVFRKDKPIATALVVDVRQDICGAVVRNLVSKDEPVKLGDSCRAEAVKN